MFGISSGHKRVKNVVVVDIGSTSAAVAIIALHGSEPATVIAAERLQLPLEERTQEATMIGVGGVLKTAGENVQKKFVASNQKKNVAIHGVSVIVHTPWCNSKTSRMNAVFEKDTVITGKIISDLAQKALKSQGVDTKNLLEANVIRVELNGYPSGKPIGKRAREVVVHVLSSDFASGMRSTLEEALQSIFPHSAPVFRSATRVAITVLNEEDNPIHDYLLVDVESEGTTFTAVHSGVPTGHEIAPLGVQTIVKKISGPGLPEDTLSQFRMLAKDQCSDPACEDIKASIARAEPEIVRIFGEAMSKSATPRRLPDALILMTHPDMFSWLSNLFSRIDFAQFTLTTQPFMLRKLHMQDLDAVSQGKMGIVEDSGLALGIQFACIEQTMLK